MSDDAIEIQITVSGEDDPVRDERAARGLRDELLELDHVLTASFVPSLSEPPPGAKGSVAPDTVVLLTTVAPAAAGTVIAFIRAWADRSIHRKVIVSSDGSLEIHGAIGRREEGLVRDLHDAQGDAGARPQARSGGAGDDPRG